MPEKTVEYARIVNKITVQITEQLSDSHIQNTAKHLIWKILQKD